MSIIGNVLLIGAFVTSLLMIYTQGGRPSQSAQVEGYLWSMLFLNIFFWIIINLSAIIISSKGGFDWIGFERGQRFFMVHTILLVICLNVTLSSFFRYEPTPSLLRIYGLFVPLVLPILITLIGFVLLNVGLRTTVPLVIYKSVLIVISVISLIGVTSALLMYLAKNEKNNKAKISEIYTRQDENHMRLLHEIDTCDVSKNMVFILGLTGDNQDAEIREKALLKVKSNPLYQEELIRLLESGWVAEAFQFLASNTVDDPQQFIEPIRIGIMKQAEVIQNSMENDNYHNEFYPEIFTWEVTRVIRTVNRHQGQGISFYKEMSFLRSVLEGHSEDMRKKLKCLKLMDKWLKSND